MGPVGPGMLPSTPMGGAAYDRPRPGDMWQPWDEALKGHWIHRQLWTNQTPDRIEHAAALYSDCFIDHLLNKAAKRNTPFFMYLGFNSPHDPGSRPRNIWLAIRRTRSRCLRIFCLGTHSIRGDYYIRDEMLAPFPRTPQDIQLHRREYYSLITYMDEQIGRILDALQQSGKAANTYVILTADHGLAVGEHGLMGKQNLYDCSLRMPLIIAGPGIAAGKRIDELVYQHCMYATTCDLAGIPIPSTVEFPSLAPLIHGQGKPPYEAMFSYYKGFQRMVRTKTHKMIVYPQIHRTQVFNIESDPWEMHDLSADPASAGVRSELTQQLKRLQAELGDKLQLDI